MRVIWYASTHYIDRETMPRTEEFEASNDMSFIQCEDVSLEKARRMSSGVKMDGIKRVIKTKNNIRFSVNDKIQFVDEDDAKGNPLILKVESVNIIVPEDRKQTLNIWPKMKYQLSDKVLYLK